MIILILVVSLYVLIWLGENVKFVCGWHWELP